MTTSIIIITGILFLVFYFKRNNRRTPKNVDITSYNSSEENFNEPVISYSIYTVDSNLNHRYLNYTHKDFPNHVGILKGQYIEIDWNIFNADLITISGVDLVKSIGRKAFYPTGNTSYTITAKNKTFEITHTIYVRVFPQNVTDKLFTSQPNIHIHSQQITQIPELTKVPGFIINKPVIDTQKMKVITLHEVLQHKIIPTSFSQKVKDYFNNKQNINK
ncbi:MAG: hypothetical protein IT275_00115 [Chitinophagales bacterium]|nr:hypothetical protein [Chitinophagales bacterium]